MIRDELGDESFIRVVGRRSTPPLGRPPSPEVRAALTELARYRTRAPKGVYLYSSHEEANADRDRWTVNAVLARQRDE